MITSYSIIEGHLRDQIEGDCFFDLETREHYSTAACWYKILPVGVVFPKHTQDVQTVVRFCNENEIAIIPRGGATGLAGQAVGLGIVLDFTKHMHTILQIEEEFVEVQPGLVLDSLNEALLSRDRFFPIDPASKALCTLGGMIATNAAGSHGVRFGATKDHVEELTIVLANGDAVTVRSPIRSSNDSVTPFYQEILQSTSTLLQDNRDLILRRFPHVPKNSSGYNISDAIREQRMDVRKVLIGSEGTLAVVVAAKLHLSPIPSHRRGVVATFSDYESTVDATLKGLELRPSAVELLDKTYWTKAADTSNFAQELISPSARAMLYFEFEGNSGEEVDDPCNKLVEVLKGCDPTDIIPLKSDSDMKRVWKLREEASQAINLGRSSQKGSFIEDVAVPISKLPLYMKSLQEILRRNEIDFSAYGHAGSGNVHCAAFVDLRNLDHYRKIEPIALEVNELAITLGGTLSGEHGDGFVRTPFLERLYGSEVYGIFRQIKTIFDPNNIFNPGKIVGKQNSTFLHDLDLS